MNETDQAILDRIWDRYMEEAGGDLRYAFRLLSIDFHRAGGLVSAGLVRSSPVVRSGLLPKEKVEAIDIPAPTQATPSN